jgi:hypothetical protein
MADDNNPGQFGNRDDTEAQASEGGKKSADPSAAGKKGAQAQPREAKVEGGKNSHKNDSND